ncbi:hypothetical protein K504DRAFT_392851 [Pleomassaria siparia CBS 279.74]|uniref:Uncharacterized protein n=1 Tax=Pleomassaria siparia CBS 279.74 TaxID=1314801 RepID=A0A6G1JT43_9PLEO|nr:hypothetical protein K504DRAFT_392851 [Pleomassaria siparia CBS 279.74]
MAFLTNVTNRIWSFVSPRKTQERREKPFKVPLTPLKRARARVPARASASASASRIYNEEMSPQTRIQQWNVETPSSSGSVDQTNLPPSPPQSLERQYHDADSIILLDEIIDMNPQGEPAWDANEDTYVAEDGDYLQKQKAVDCEVEIARRREQGRNLLDAGWTEDAVALFQKLGTRGAEPLLLQEWYDDFEMLPEILFTTIVDLAYIKPMYGSDFHAQKALSDLFDVGPRARDALLTKAPVRTAERQIRLGIHKYNRWAMKEDGGFPTLWDGLSLFQIHTCPKTVNPSALEAKAIHRLKRLAERWRDAFRHRVIQNSKQDKIKPDLDCIPEVPTLYAVLASHTIMAFVSYDAKAANPGLRTIAMFDFGLDDYDVWNAFAVAIFVIHCRNRMIELEEFLPYAETTGTDSDPDI